MADQNQCPPCDTKAAIDRAPKGFYIGSVGFGAMLGLLVGAVFVGIKEDKRSKRRAKR